MKPQTSPQILTLKLWALAAVAILLAASTLHAANMKWSNAGNGAWETGANWSTGSAPTTGDAVAITNTTATVSMTNGSTNSWLTVGSLVVGGSGAGGATLLTQLTNDYTTFTVSTNVTIGDSIAGTTNGSWNIEGGTVLVGGKMTLASYSSTGTVTVVNGALLTNSGTGIYVGGNGLGMLTVSNGGQVKAGTLSVGYSTSSDGRVLIDNGSVTIGTAYIGHFSGGKGKITLAGNGSLQAQYIYLGNNNATGEFIQSNGVVSVTNGLYIGNAAGSASGTYQMLGGILTNSGNTYIGQSSTGEMTQSDGLIRQKSLAVGNNSGSSGLLKLFGGTNVVSGIGGITIGTNCNATGTIIVNGGNLIATNLGSSYLTIGKQGTGTLILSNGIVWTDTTEFVGHENGGNGSLYVYGGTNIVAGLGIAPFYTNNTGRVEIANAGVVQLTGNMLNIGGSGGNGTLIVRDGGILQFEANPTISRGGISSFVVTNATVSYKGVAGADVAGLKSAITSLGLDSRLRLENSTNKSGLNTFTVGGVGEFSTLELTGGNSQFASTNLIISSGGRLDVVGGISALSATITNSGIISVSNAHAIYNSNVANLNAYVSDPSTNTFNGKFTVGTSGYVLAEAGDIYAFGADYTMQSTNGAQFNMSEAQAIFANSGYGITTGITNHTFDLTGSGAVNLGDNWLNISQLATNFSIGTLTIALGNQVALTGGTTNALYVGLLDLSAWDTNFSALTNTLQSALNLTNVTLFYDKNLAGNEYLGGNTYSLWSGSELRPIPEPTTIVSLAVGLLILGFFRVLKDMAVRRLPNKR